jgi:hypothetical protein
MSLDLTDPELAADATACGRSHRTEFARNDPTDSHIFLRSVLVAQGNLVHISLRPAHVNGRRPNKTNAA